MSPPLLVAIDGPAASGKSTIARLAAAELEFHFISSGSLYRAITFAVLQKGCDPANQAELLEIVASVSLGLGDGWVEIDGVRHQERALHAVQVDAWVATHSSFPQVRAAVNSVLRGAVAGIDAVVEGRDIGTEVFPDAGVKIYLDADLEIRADRRRRQLGGGSRGDALIEEIRRRDAIDAGKAYGPLSKAPDAFLVNTSHLTAEQACARVVGIVRSYRTTLGATHHA